MSLFSHAPSESFFNNARQARDENKHVPLPSFRKQSVQSCRLDDVFEILRSKDAKFPEKGTCEADCSSLCQDNLADESLLVCHGDTGLRNVGREYD